MKGEKRMLVEMICAGFGGQGILTTGILISYCAFDTRKEFTWFPSYGAEMRGGTANCTVKISDEEIASPYAKEIDILLAMNGAAVDKFENRIKEGGYLFVNASLVQDRTYREDIHVIPVDTVELAKKASNPKGANIAMIGALIKKTGILKYEECDQAIEKYFASHGKARFTEANRAALKAGYEFVS